jgi:DNA-binding XRE family transcriptional regulator|tara:strand:- start:338 stop:610 length:273 start_codon:yes stop_codon:yes gene_type:complete
MNKNIDYINPNIALKHKIYDLNLLSNGVFKIQAKKISMNKLAKLAGVNETTLWRHLNGTNKISRQKAINYAKVLNCHPAEILFKQKGTNE